MAVSNILCKDILGNELGNGPCPLAKLETQVSRMTVLHTSSPSVVTCIVGSTRAREANSMDAQEIARRRP